MREFVYYPFTIPTLNRYTHLKRLVDSLARNADADKTELVIGLDFPPTEKYREGYEKIKAYLPTITGFKKVTILTADKNLGPMGNGRKLREYVVSQGYDGYLSAEDDNEFSPCTIRYMNSAMNKYRNDERVINICAHSGTVFEGVSAQNIYCNIDTPAYGLGVWFDKEKNVLSGADYFYRYLKKSLRQDIKLYLQYPGVIYQLIKMVEAGNNYGDVRRVMTNMIKHSFAICPTVSLSRNWGADGSGLHSGVLKGLEKQYISEEKDFELDDIEISGTKEMYRRLFYRNMPQNKIKFLLYFVYKFLYLLKFYYFGKLGTKGTYK
jgi:hypothetical protein